MKKLLVGLGAACLVGLALTLSGATRFEDKTTPVGGLQIQSEKRNPWSHLNLNNNPNDFQFAIVSDRTGGHRAKIFSRAVELLNVMQPEFVLSVGDLIEGGRKEAEKLQGEWKEFDSYVNRLQMPFFYVPGNHDLANPVSDKLWQEKLGRRYYRFIYRNVLFLVLNTEDTPYTGTGMIGPEQITWIKKTLEETRDVQWTVVAFHKPIWNAANLDKNGWLEVEKALADRPYTVFVGHVHRYQKFVRNGRDYYQLATTGGGSRLRGVSFGEFDHIVWVTMKKTGPVLANIKLDSILPDDLRVPETQETGVTTPKRKPAQPVRAKVFYQGVPPVGASVVLTSVGDASPAVRADGLVEADGSVRLSTYGAFDGVPTGTYAVTITWRQPYIDAQGKPGPNQIPAAYAQVATTPLKAEIQEGENDLVFEVQR